MAILSIGRSSSRCLSCKRGANPNETGHITIAEYSDHTGSPGCGEAWTAVSMEYGRVEIDSDGKPEFVPDIGWNIFENLRGLPLVGIGTKPGQFYPLDK